MTRGVGKSLTALTLGFCFDSTVNSAPANLTPQKNLIWRTEIFMSFRTHLTFIDRMFALVTKLSEVKLLHKHLHSTCI